MPKELKPILIVFTLLVSISAVLVEFSVLSQQPAASAAPASAPRKVAAYTAGNTPTTAPSVQPTGDPQPSLPLRAAFYYPWFPDAWRQKSISPYTNYTPSLGIYDSSDPEIVRKHISAMQYSNIATGIASWWGKDTVTDENLGVLLQAAAGTSFRWAVYYEPQGAGNVTGTQIADDLTYLRDRYGNDPSYLRINGRFVVFVYAKASDGCEMADTWKRVNNVNAFIVLKVFANYRSCPSQPDGWHQYAPSSAESNQKGYSYTISPGFWKVSEGPRLTRDLNRWYASIRNMVASQAPFQLITSFNEWGEGTAIEPAKEWQTDSGYGAFLDALHTNGEGTPPAMTFDAAPPPRGTPTSKPSSTATPQAKKTTAPLTATPQASKNTTTPVTPPALPVLPALPANNGDPVLGAVGDIACDPTSPNFAPDGQGKNPNNCREKQTSDILVALKAAGQLSAVAVLGDDTYENGAYDKYLQSYDPTWGRLKDITRPAPGNHDYLTKGASGYYEYFGAAAGDPKKGYYSYDLGTWHIVVVNSNCSGVGGCGKGSPQENWLQADLAQNAGKCTLAYWHHPRYSSGLHGNTVSMQTIWQDLNDYGTAVVLTGHSHDYERFAPQDANGNANPEGIREFVVGTGGKNHTGLEELQPNSEVFEDKTYGILKLTLHPNSYAWMFVPEAGKTFTDSGTGACQPRKP